MSCEVSRPPGRWTLWVVRPVAALVWLLREAMSRRKTYVVVWFNEEDETVRLGEHRFYSEVEAVDFCRRRDYQLLGRMRLRIEPCPLARWLAGC